jgi:hypothetical protein
MPKDMAIETVRAKLDEARSFLAEMRDQEQRAFGDKEEKFHKALSGFLGAGRSAVYRLEKMANYETWREAWNAQNPSKDSCLKRIHDKRDTDVHEGGSGPIVRLKQIKVGVGGSYSDKSGTLESWGTPSPLIDVDTGATIYVPQHFFDIDGTERPVTEVCAEYLTALEQMVAQYEADTSQ